MIRAVLLIFFIPTTNKGMKYRILKFPIKKVFEQQTQTESVLSDYEETMLFPELLSDETEKATSKAKLEPTDNQIPSESRYSERERRPLIRLGDCIAEQEIENNQVMSSVDYCYRVSSFPQTYQKTLQSPDS